MLESSKRAFASIFHPTDFSRSSEAAFEHALRIALGSSSSLNILHVTRDKNHDPAWDEFPSVRQSLERWKKLPKDSPREAVSEKLGLKVKKLERDNSRPLAAMARFLEKQPADLIVMTTEGREGLPRWLNPSVSENLARHAKTATLFLPSGKPGFVGHDDGQVRLDRVLIPVDHKPDPQYALDAAGAFMASLDVLNPHMEALYIGDEDHQPRTAPPQELACVFERTTRQGKPVDEIIKAAEERKVNLIVMTTEGRNGFLDAFRGSTTEQVLRRAPCPILAVPAVPS